MLLSLAVIGEVYSWQAKRQRAASTRGKVERLGAPRLSHDAYGRAGDLVLGDTGGARITVAASPDLAGHRPLLGAIVDVATGSADVPDPLIWFRTMTADRSNRLSDVPVQAPQPFTCADGGPGIRSMGVSGTGFSGEICVSGGGRFTVTTAVGEGRTIVDEVNVGSLPAVVDGEGAAWDMEHDSTFLAFAEGGTAVLLEAPRLHVSRTFSHFGAETFPSPVLVRYGADPTVKRTLHVLGGDVLDAVARLAAATRVFEVTFGPRRGGEVSVRDDAGRELATGTVRSGDTRVFRLPPGLGTYAVLRDDRGVVTDPHVPLPLAKEHAAVTAGPGPSGSLELAYLDESNSPLPVHVLFKGLDGTPDPRPVAAEARAVRAGRSLYLPGGHSRVTLPPGRYRLTASHGLSYSLSVRDIDVGAGGTSKVEDRLRPVIDTTGWLSADFHLHSAPSPDSSVSLEDRVTSLVCEGVDLAVATDHNRVTDLAPAARALGQEGRLGTLVGVEMTTAGERWGHFNAFPLPVPPGAPEEGVPVYFDEHPGDSFASARALGAKVVQVNHARMDPGIGYFDLAHLDAKTGRSDAVFATDFDVLEAFNGMWIETRAKVREGPSDLVALARRGKKVAATGNSDSHKLLFEEAGYPRTWVHVPRDPVATRAPRTVTALLAGDTTVSSGPFVEMTVEGQGIGSVVKPTGPGIVHVKIRVSAPAWVPVEHVELLRDDAVVERFTVDGPAKDGVRLERELDVGIARRDAVLLAWAEAEAPLPDVVPYAHARAIGFTGLVYVDADGDGTVKVPAAGE